MKANFKSLLGSISAITLVLSTTACLDSEMSTSDSLRADYLLATTSQYARDIERYAVQSSFLVTNHSSWESRTFPQGELIDFAALGGVPDPTNSIHSGLCVSDTDPNTAVLITWLTGQTDDGVVSLKGLGTGLSGGLMSALTERVPEDSLAVYEDGELRMMGSGVLRALDANCADYAIPEQSPVVISHLSIPQLPAGAYVKEEFRVSPCDAGQEGHFVEKSQVTHMPNGQVIQGQWNEDSNTCKDAISVSSYQTAMTSVEGFILGALAGVANNGTSSALDAGLSTIACRETSVNSEDKTSPEYDTEKSQRATANTQKDPESFHTCSAPTQASALQSIGEVRVSLEGVDNYTAECGGSAGRFRDSLNGHTGRASHTRWSGEARYRRDIYRHIVDDNLTSVSGENKSQREDWYGVSIECSRLENLSFRCNDVYPGAASRADFRRTNNTGFNYRRTNRISGWANATNLRPNEPVNPSWNLVSARCQWLQTDNWNCTAGRRIQTGERNRTHTSSSLGQALTVGSWNLVRPARCEGTRVVTQGCPSGQGGNIRVDQERIFTSNAPGTGRWGSWYETSRFRNCHAPQTRTRSASCPSGQVGSVSINERRVYSASGPGTGSWQAWNETGRSDNCRTPAPLCRGGGEGPGSDSRCGGRHVNDHLLGGGGGPEYSYSTSLNANGNGGTRTRTNLSTGRSTSYQVSNNDYTVSSMRSGGSGGGGGDRNVSESDSGGGGGGGGDSVLCTYFYQKGLIDRKTYIADMKYARDHAPQEMVNGYHLWAIPTVAYLQKKHRPIAEPVMRFIVTNWAQDMAYRVGYTDKKSYTGFMIRTIGEAICSGLGKFVGKQDYAKLWSSV